MKRWWITLYGPLGSVFKPLDDCDAETLRRCLIGEYDYKLERLTQDERNARR